VFIVSVSAAADDDVTGAVIVVGGLDFQWLVINVYMLQLNT